MNANTLIQLWVELNGDSDRKGNSLPNLASSRQAHGRFGLLPSDRKIGTGCASIAQTASRAICIILHIPNEDMRAPMRATLPQTTLPLTVNGEIVGAIGVSSAQPDWDVQIAAAGAAALTAQP
jgi:hypothetical protein